MAESGSLPWTSILVLTALLLSAVDLSQIASTYTAAYLVAPQEIADFIDTADFSVQENEGYDRDVAKVQRLEDKIRLSQLLREIQKAGDDLREALNSLLIEEGTTQLRTGARLLWASKRSQLADRVRRLDLLRMRFLVVYMGIITFQAEKQQATRPSTPKTEKVAAAVAVAAPPPPPLPKNLNNLTNNHVNRPPISRPPVRRLTTQAIGHQEHVTRPQRTGWAGVVEELQTSPRMHQRHASIERAMSEGTSESP